jgi:gliding motility-associated protein GldM
MHQKYKTMAVNSPNSPRQKMINLMYLVFIGMLALNVSKEVLDGFAMVEESLMRSVKSATQRNDRVFADLENSYKANPVKTKEWFEIGLQVKAKTDSLFHYVQDLKTRIVIKSDGKNGNPENLKHPDDLNAPYDVMFEHGKNDGARLRSAINSYREFIAALVTNPSIKNIIESNLSTDPTARAKENKQTWEESMFWQMPVAASVTLLTKLQNDIRYAEGAVLSDLQNNVDVRDYRVNSVLAKVIPVSQTVIKGSPYQADIVLSAVDSTQRPKVFVDQLKSYLPDDKNGRLSLNTGAAGAFTISGFIEMQQGDNINKYTFSEPYYVQEPSATVAPVIMNILYAGYSMDVNIAVPGIASSNVTATMTNGTLTPKGNGIWVAKAQNVGTEAVITVSAKMADGRSQVMRDAKFRVRPLPDPKPLLTVPGRALPFYGGALSRGDLANVNVAEAAIDDGVLNIPFTVVRFDISTANNLGITVRESSDGSRFSDRQKALMRDSRPGKTLYVRGMVVRGPAGDERTLQSAMEIIVNN